ncbi:MAG TPA: PEP/pyruvate-binding domain-containing protein, partial [Thermoanaerobaculia bacterium]|nr:PEP/pyruvate-binding domain-containing protein [Thermoanaerobaculia bacterium]
MRAYVLGFQEVDRTDIGVVGGKGANLGELSRLEGIRVPEGFCVSTEAFKRVMGAEPAIGDLLDRLARLKAEDREAIRELAAAIRGVIEGIAIPQDVQEAIARFLARLGEQEAYAVRSSATAEDLPGASFAGQQDTYLNVIGKPAILKHISRCWASLFTERAVAYRLQHGFDHRKVHMAVVVQKMLRPQASGILFTADPVTGNRKVASIEAVFGLGEALVSGLVNADGYKVRDGQVIEKAERQDRPVLTDEKIVRLARLGRKIEGHFGQPQDIEWCLVEDDFHIVQSRPITTLYPVPEAEDQGNHVYVSVGHQQMMTDPMKPLGLSLFQAGHMVAAGGRLFVDVTKQLATPAGRDVLLNVLGRSDLLVRDALTTLIERDFIELSPPDSIDPNAAWQAKYGGSQAQIDDPAIVADLIADSQASIEELKRDIRTKSGTDLLDFMEAQHSRQSLFEPRNLGAIMAGMNAATWINDQMMAWLGEKNPADTLAQSAPNNVTSEMGLALLDVADVIRPHPEVIAYLQQAKDDGFLEGLLPLEGGPEAHDAMSAYLDKYGMRGVGEIDVTRTRWREAPTTLVPLILSNIKNFEPGAASRRFEQGRQEAAKKEQELLERLRQLPDGPQKAEETQRMIRRLRSFVGYREYPKYGIVSRYFVYKQALLEEAGRLVRANVLQEPEDIYYLTLQELREVVRTQTIDDQIISQRKAEHERNRKLTPPRVLTSDGEVALTPIQRWFFEQGFAEPHHFNQALLLETL